MHSAASDRNCGMPSIRRCHHWNVAFPTSWSASGQGSLNRSSVTCRPANIVYRRAPGEADAPRIPLERMPTSGPSGLVSTEIVRLLLPLTRSSSTYAGRCHRRTADRLPIDMRWTRRLHRRSREGVGGTDDQADLRFNVRPLTASGTPKLANDHRAGSTKV